MKVDSNMPLKKVLNFSWTEEEVADLLQKEAERYIEQHYPDVALADVNFGRNIGSVYEGGLYLDVTAEFNLED